MIQATIVQSTLPPPLDPPAHNLKPTRRGVPRLRKYIFTARMDGRIREIYLGRRGTKTLTSIRGLAEQVHIPHWAIKKRARELG
jgi:hypothetical protein